MAQMRRNRRRWGDHDRDWGPFTYARDRSGYRTLAIVLTSPGDDDDDGASGDCALRISGFGHTLITTMPPVIRPWRHWVDTSKMQYHGVDGRPLPLEPGRGYWDIHPRQYGFSLSGSGSIGDSSFLQVFLGAQTHDSSTTESWSCFLPWTEWRHVRHSLYGFDGRHFYTEWDGGPYASERFDRIREAEQRCPSCIFAFRDYDGELLLARTRIGEREWRFGTGWFEWLSTFRKPLIRRSLDIRFSGETGERKGSWKGGTMGTGIDMTPGELHEAAFRRYCAEHRMTFIAELKPAALVALGTVTDVWNPLPIVAKLKIKLHELGLIERGYSPGSYGMYRLTEAGRSALKLGGCE